MAGPQRLANGNDNWSGFLGFDDYVFGLGGSDRVTTVAETDTLSGFENVQGSNRAETIAGASGANVLEDRGVNDILKVAEEATRSMEAPASILQTTSQTRLASS